MFGMKVIALSLGLGTAAAATVSLPVAEQAREPQGKRIERIASDNASCDRQVWPNIAQHCIRNGAGAARNVRAIALNN